MPDGWEDRYGLDRNDPNDASGDADTDGLSNLDEYLNGTEPTVDDRPSSPLVKWPLDGPESGVWGRS